MPSEQPYAVRLICRFPPGVKGGWDRLREELESAGWRVEGLKAARGDMIVELASSSPDGSELMLRAVGSVEGEALDSFLRASLPACWYVDVYYHFRSSHARAAAERLAVKFEERRKWKMKMEGVELVVESYPSAGALTASYRVGWREGWRSPASKIHERITGAGRRGNKIFFLRGWRR